MNKVDQHFRAEAGVYGTASERGIWRRWKEREFAAVLDHLQPLAGQRLLELGCGGGWYAKRLVEHNPAFCVASDRLPEMVRSFEAPGIVRVVNDLAHIPIQTQFERVLCAGALEFVSSVDDFFVEAKRVLSPAGRIVVLVPPRNIWGRLYAFWHRTHGLRIRLFSLPSLKATLATRGLAIRRFTYATPFSLVLTLGVSA